MKSKSKLKTRLIRLFKGKQGGAVPTAIKVLTAVVCGAIIMTGLYGVVTSVVLPASSDKVTSMFAYEGSGGTGGSGDGSYEGGTGNPDAYEMLDGDGTVVNTAAFTPLTFRSSAPYDTFEAVKVDGEVVDFSNYTVREGSTIVTFNADYTKALSAGDHEIEIVSNDGSAKANFNVDTSNVIPEGATYTKATGEVLEAGAAFPSDVAAGDIYVYGDYQYCFGYQWCVPDGMPSNECPCVDTAIDGWGVCVVDNTKQTYTAILENINKKSITSMIYAFYNCVNLTDISSITIPSGVTVLNRTFYECTSLVSLDGFIIPDTVTTMFGTFEGCTALVDASGLIISGSVTDMEEAFANCSALETLPLIPNGVTSLYNAFSLCTSLTDLSNFVIPNSVVNMGDTFAACFGLTAAPELPSSVTNAFYTFEVCTSLTGEISMPCTLMSKNYTYSDCPATITYYHFDGCGH